MKTKQSIPPKVPTHEYLFDAVTAVGKLNSNLAKLELFLKNKVPVIQFCETFIETRIAFIQISAEQSYFDEYNYDFVKAKHEANCPIDLSQPATCAGLSSLQLSSSIAYGCNLLAATLHSAESLYGNHPHFNKVMRTYSPDWYKNKAFNSSKFDPCLQQLFDSTTCLHAMRAAQPTIEQFQAAPLALSPISANAMPPQIAKIKDIIADRKPLLANQLKGLFPFESATDVVLLHTFEFGSDRITQVFNFYLDYNLYPLLCLAGLTYNAPFNCFEYCQSKDYSVVAHANAVKKSSKNGKPDSMSIPVATLFKLLTDYANYVYVSNSKTAYINHRHVIGARLKGIADDPLNGDVFIASAHRPS